MTETFYSRIPTLSDPELLEYVHHASKYKYEAVEAAVSELGRRGHPVSEDEWHSIRKIFLQKNTPKGVFNFPKSPSKKWTGIRYDDLTALLVLVSGWAAAAVVFFTSRPKPSNLPGIDPLDSKQYLRELEVYGGKMNVLGVKFMNWMNGLWHGRTLAVTIAFATTVLALLLWLAGRCRRSDPNGRPQ